MTIYKNKTQAEWTAWIDGITWETHYVQVMMRLYPQHGFQHVNSEGKSGEQLYDAILPFQLVGVEKVYATRLPWQDVQAELVEYKADLTREGDYAYRLLALHNWRQAKIDAGVYPHSHGLDAVLYEMLQEPDDITLQYIETADIPLREAHEFEMGVSEKQARMYLGQRCIAAINYMNERDGINDQQIAAILGSGQVKQIIDALSTGSLRTAKALVAALDLAGLGPMDQSYKDKITEMIDDYLGE